MLDTAFHRFGPFIITRTLGRGGMGEVFVARTPWAKNPVAAVKRLRPDVARVPTFEERFQHEAELSVRLSHANVVATLDVGSVEGQLYVASELILGKDAGLIADRLRERGQGGPAAVAVRLLLDTLSGLAYVHGARDPEGVALKLVHRDVTPGNVLVGYDGNARLADFGLAKSVLTEKSKLTNHGEILGTPHYLAPEVIRGEQATPVSDLYGLGSVIYRFLTGIAPHQGTTAEVLLKVLTEEPRALSDLRPDLPPWLVVFVHRLLDKDPSRRPYDAAVLLKQLTQDARQAGLLVPKTSVGRWLTNLFEHEKTDEFEEYERVSAIRHDDVPERHEGTVVLARPQPGLVLEAPMPVQEADVDSLGTELELSEEEVRSAAGLSGAMVHSGGIELRPGVLPRVEVEEESSRPSGVTQYAQAARSEEDELLEYEPDETPQGRMGGSLAPEITDELLQDDPNEAEVLSDDFEEDGMPTRAMMLKHTSEGVRIEGSPNEVFGGEIKTSPDRMADPEEDESEGPTRYGPIVSPMLMGDETVRPDESMDREPETRLPGFLEGPRPSPVVRPARPHNPESVIVSPVPTNKSRSGPDMPMNGVHPRSVPPSVELRAPNNSNPAMNTASRQPPPVSNSASHPKAPVHPQETTGKNLLLLAGLLFVAIALGIGIGVIVASFKDGDQVVVVQGQPTLKQRLQRVKAEIGDRRKKGQPVPPDTSNLMADVASAMLDGNQAEALKKIRAAEQLLGLQATPRR